MTTYAIVFSSGNNTDIANVDASSKEEAIGIYQGQYSEDVIHEVFIADGETKDF